SQGSNDELWFANGHILFNAELDARLYDENSAQPYQQIQAGWLTGAGTPIVTERLEYSSDNGQTWQDVSHAVNGTSVELDDPTLTESTTIRFRVVNVAANGAEAEQEITIDTAALGFVINGQSAGDESGRSVSSAGDVNGDGLADLIVGAPGANGDTGRSYVMFGKADGTAVELSDVAAGMNGFVINGQSADDWSGQSVSSAGDVNGDGLADLIVAASQSDHAGMTEAGRSYVVFGKTGGTPVELSDIAENETGGFVINGQSDHDNSGWSVSAAGDVNGDSLADVIVGAPGNAAGRSYVVFGKADDTSVELSNISNGDPGGFVINGQSADDNSGLSVSSAGDVNGDGLADLIVGAPQSDPAGKSGAGRSYVVFSQTGNTAVELSGIAASGTGGFVINGQSAGDQSGVSVSSAGDVNGDGLADLIVGAHNSNPATGGSNAGRSYVVFGKTGGPAVELSIIAAGGTEEGFVINGRSAGDYSGYSVSAAGDVNGDGLADLIVGTFPGLGAAGFVGRSFVVFGKAGDTPVELSDIEAGTGGGFVINGQSEWDHSGSSVAAAGDVNGDGLADLIVGAPFSDPAGQPSAGRSYVIFGKTGFDAVNLGDVALGGDAALGIDFAGTSAADEWSGTTASETALGGAGNDTLTGNGGADVLYGGAGNDTLVLNADNIAHLSQGLTDGRLARVDGGGGIDTLAVAGTGVTLDLTQIANQAAGDPETGSRIASIEKINLSGTGNNTLTLSVGDVLDMAGMNQFNDDNGWTGLGTSVQRHQLVIDGDAGDVVSSFEAPGTWSLVGTASDGTNTYNVFNATNSATSAQLLVNVSVTMRLLAQGFVINGEAAWDNSGWSVASAGDVNGDGLADLIVGAPDADGYTGRSYVVFGKADGTAVELSNIAASGTDGFAINGQAEGGWSGGSVSAAGDVNGDGLADLIVGARSAEGQAGRSYVVFGKTGGTTVELSDMAAGGTDGFMINGQSGLDYSGESVSSAGDVNGDGLADLIVGASQSDPAMDRGQAGRSYVVFGKVDGSVVELSDIAAGGTGGFVINGQSAWDESGGSVSAAGDVNGDGLADLIVGARSAEGQAGRSYVIFGKTGGTAVELSAIEAGTGDGFVINGQSDNDKSGHSVSSAGDVNGDGLADLIVGAPYSAPTTGDPHAGRSYVVFGKVDGSVVELSDMAAGGTGGFVINGQSWGDQSGISVSSAGDVNGDGLADLIVGAHYANPEAGTDAGRSYVVFGKTGGTPVELSAIEAGTGGGFVINGQSDNDNSGYSVASAGDVNGDGLADLIVGATWALPATEEEESAAGRSYVIFGKTDTNAVNLGDVALGGDAALPIDFAGTSGADTWSGTTESETALGGAGNDTLTGNGGADVLYGGAGNDTLVLNAENIDHLSQGLTDGRLARVDGGGGIDTLAVAGAGVTLDLTQIANQAAGDPETGSRIASIEKINLSGTGNNTLTLSVGDVLDMAGMNQFNSGNDWTGLGASVLRHQLVIDGDAGDVVSSFEAPGTWSFVGTASDGTNTYNVFNATNSATSAQLLVNVSVTMRLLAQGFVINGQSAGDLSGWSVASAGDVNGDGLADLIVGAPGANGYAGRSYVMFGKADGTAAELSDIADNETGGFVIIGQAAEDWSGYSVASAGDVNGDGLADLIVAASQSDHAGMTEAGRSYVVFGKTGGTAVELSTIEAGTGGGFVINGKSGYDNSGWSVSAAGDVNGDSLADVIVGAPGNAAGRSYVVFGKADDTSVELSNISNGDPGGFVINGQSADDNSGLSVSSAGDVNGDGLADLIVGAPQSDPAGKSGAGRSYVVFSQTGNTAVELSGIAASGTGGFVINGQSAGDQSGVSVSSAGDVNGDGLADLIVGAHRGDPATGGADAGLSYVVFGKTGGTAVELSAIAENETGGFVINGHSDYDNCGFSVSAAGDVNGDGLADLIVGAHYANPEAGTDAGRSYVVFGKTGGTAVELSAIEAGTGGGFVINGQSEWDVSGESVSAAGDVNGDGLADLIVGAPGGDPATDREDAGRSYVIFGKTGFDAVNLGDVALGGDAALGIDFAGTSAADEWSGTTASETALGGAGNDTLTGNGGADVLYGGAGNDTLVLNADNIDHLSQGLTDGRLARVDGGGGIDTLVVAGTGVTLDLTQIANQAAGDPETGSRIASIEKINLSGSGNNTLTLLVGDVLDMAGMNQFNDGNGWTGLGTSVQRHQLVIDGDAGDSVSSSGWTDTGGTVSYGGQTYAVYHSTAASTLAQLLVDEDITRTGVVM
ncbi:MAG: FG-GAP-like repeat-containing protein, partial [Hydrogenophaga sp.]|uniref:hypothetical protein n=1 Tax=Hydrogenophaga sp. TaxID=1904254 RepID=UPI003D0F7C51